MSDFLSLAFFSANYPCLSALFANGWPCGDTFIPSSQKCWTDPNSGQRLKVPLAYKVYVKRRAETFKKAENGILPQSREEQQMLQSVQRLQAKVASKKERLQLASAAASAGAKQILPSGIADVDPKKIAVDPGRFQYKITGALTKTGEVGSLGGVRKWDGNLAGIVQVWRDPKDKKVYVVNGHNRLALAKKLDVPQVTARFIGARSPEEARAIGALTNIAEGRGNAQDAAKFFRDSGLSKSDLDKKGIPMREKIATDGLALSKLSDNLFNRVVQGEIPESRAVVIGQTLDNPKQQEELIKLIEKEEKRGKKITNDTIGELADMVAGAPSKEESQGSLFDLLGFSPESRSLAVEKAQLQAAIKRQLSREKRLFGTVGKSRAAEDLAKAGNKINIDESAEIAEVADKALGAFDQEKKLIGAVSDALNKGAERLADGESAKKVEKEIYEQVLDSLQKTYRFGKGAGSGRSEKSNRSGDGNERFAASAASSRQIEFGCSCNRVRIIRQYFKKRLERRGKQARQYFRRRLRRM